jgi:hypothetical protein
VRALSVIGLLVAVATVPTHAAAGLAKQCRKACMPAVAECRATGQSRRACRKLFLPRCKVEGLEVCASSTTTTTTTPEPSATTTSTTDPSTGGGGGVMSVNVEELQVEGDDDPRLYTFSITIGYSVVTANAVTEVALDPSTFTVLDEDTGIVYQAESASAPEHCSVDDVVTKNGPDVTCVVRFMMPASVGEGSAQDGGVHSKLQFQSMGLHGSELFSS